MRRQLITIDEAVPAVGQHKKPCSDCPWARKSLPGWLGGSSVDEWLAAAHSDGRINCHTLIGAQCAGSAIYRRNILKRPRDPNVLVLDSDKESVFATPPEFIAHHNKTTNGGGGAWCPAEQTEATKGTPQQPQCQELEMSDLKAKLAEVKTKHAATLEGMKVKHAAAVTKAKDAGTKAAGKVIESVKAIDTHLNAIDDIIGDQNLASDKKCTKIAALVAKAQKVADKHLA